MRSWGRTVLGKSTLIKILSGYHQPDLGGGVRIEGQDLPFQTPVQSYRLGCRFVQQDVGLVSTLSVLDNMALGSGFPTTLGTIKGKDTYKQAKQDLERLQPGHRSTRAGGHAERLGAHRRGHRPRPA